MNASSFFHATAAVLICQFHVTAAPYENAPRVTLEIADKSVESNETSAQRDARVGCLLKLATG
jgi:hypothetical protein